MPFYILGKNVQIWPHDNLDFNIAFYKVLVESGLIFSPLDTIIPGIMNGLPRSVFSSEWNLITWLFYFFEPFTAYVINLTLTHFIAFIGMYILIKYHILKNKKNEVISLGVSICFAILPFWPTFGITIAGLPLALYSFLNFRENISSKKDWFILFLIPFYSTFLASFMFLIIIIGFLWLIDVLKEIYERAKIGNVPKQKFLKELKDHVNWKFLSSILFMTVIFLIVEYRLVYSMFFNSEFVSHRTEFQHEIQSFTQSIELSVRNFINGQYHAHSLHNFVIMASIFIAIIIILLKILVEIRSHPSEKKKTILKIIIEQKTLLFLLVINASISIWYGFWYSEIWVALKNNFWVFNAIQFNRFHFLQPLLWYIIFAYSLQLIVKTINIQSKKIRKTQNIQFGKVFALILIALQIPFIFQYNNAYSGLIPGSNRSWDYDLYSWEEFFAVQQFQNIKEDIGRPQDDYRVVSIGIHPSISQYNGFHTLDGYLTNYPLEYKLEFRRIIDKELEKNLDLQAEFDNWGSRCYILVNELSGYEYTRDLNVTINNLELNTDILKEMGGEYIFSAVEIFNTANNNLTLTNIYEYEKSAWRIYVYQII
jgi:hypothetical protein